MLAFAVMICIGFILIPCTSNVSPTPKLHRFLWELVRTLGIAVMISIGFILIISYISNVSPTPKFYIQRQLYTQTPPFL